MNLKSEIISITERAGQLLFDRERLEVSSKGSKENYVSSTDLRVQDFLRAELSRLLPEAAFVGEENDLNDFDAEYCWVVDPIDGTGNFVRGMSLSAVSVALLRGGRPYIGAVHNPYLGETFSAERGGGAYLNGERIAVSGRPFENAVFCTAWAVYEKSLAAPCFDLSQRVYGLCEDIRRLGTAAWELCCLAAGRVELFFEARLFPWDYTASLLIIEEAGGLHCGLQGPVSLDSPSPVIAANSRESLELLRDMALEAFDGVVIPGWDK